MRILPENEPSNAVALRLGASFDGLQPNKITYKGKLKMANCYSLLPEAPHSEVYANQTQTQTQTQNSNPKPKSKPRGWPERYTNRQCFLTTLSSGTLPV
jgi:hypothetical protein